MNGIPGVSGGGPIYHKEPASAQGRIGAFLASQIENGLEIRIGDHYYFKRGIAPSGSEENILDENMNPVSNADFYAAVSSVIPRERQSDFLQYLKQFISSAGDVSGRHLNLNALIEAYSSGVSVEDAVADTNIISEPPPPSTRPGITTEVPF